jgi:exodeoxyribonuclease VII small subunit
LKIKKSKEGIETESFESAFKKLETIMHKLENEIPEYSIDKILEEYEEGVRLLKVCRDKLRDAELRIEKIGTEDDSEK